MEREYSEKKWAYFEGGHILGDFSAVNWATEAHGTVEIGLITKPINFKMYKQVSQPHCGSPLVLCMKLLFRVCSTTKYCLRAHNNYTALMVAPQALETITAISKKSQRDNV